MKGNAPHNISTIVITHVSMKIMDSFGFNAIHASAYIIDAIKMAAGIMVHSSQ